MTVLDTSVDTDKIKSRKPIKEDITVVTLVEYPRIIYHKHFLRRSSIPYKTRLHPST